MSYAVRFDRGNRGWTCSVFQLGVDGLAAGPTVATGTGTTKDAARDAALALTEDAAIRAALTNSDNTRPYWVQGPVGEEKEAQRIAAANNATKQRTRK